MFVFGLVILCFKNKLYVNMIMFEIIIDKEIDKHLVDN